MLAKRLLPDFERPTQELAQHILEVEARETDLTARYQQQDLFADKKPCVQWLKKQINETVTALITQNGVHHLPSWGLFSWYNVNRFGDHHAPHTHPHSYLSGTYYVQLPRHQNDPLVENPHSGCISFYDPRNGANMITTGSEPDSRPVYRVTPSPGTLLIWPSPLQHAVYPNLSGDLRISISFNVIVDKK
jgi:uncharacterized protein (TIGR02466 family)